MLAWLDGDGHRAPAGSLGYAGCRGPEGSTPIALADCFAIALAEAEGAQLLTGDPKIVDRADDLPYRVVDLRGHAVAERASKT